MDQGATVSTLTEAGDSPRSCIAARVLAHPDPDRVGEFVPLFDHKGGGVVAVSRLLPEFRRPDGRLSAPLASPRITRNPLEIERRGDGLCLRYRAEMPPIEVNGRPLLGERLFSEDDLRDGLVILSGKDLALWIGWLDLVEPAADVQGMVGESTAMRRLRQQIHRVAALDVPVLLRGETGVGKELVAAAIHAYSRRAGAKYVAVNVAGVPPTVAASELFGHRRGSFTGAVEERKGYFVQADGGTLFLDEIGDVTSEVQALLLRAVQEGVIQPIGGGTRQVDVRLIAATDSDLESAVARREFREPLLRRFSYEIRVPPLRARRDDIGILFYHLLRERLATMGEARRLSGEGGDGAPWVPASYVADSVRHDWPGNVRELANVALAFAVENRDRPRARVSDELRGMLRPRPAPEGEPPRASESGRDLKAPGELQEEDFVLALRAEKWSPERAAKRLGISKSHLYKRAASIGVIRLAKDLSDAEIRAAMESARGDLDEAAERLRVSGRGLRLRLKR